MRVLATVALPLVAVLALVGCGGPEGDVPPPTFHTVRTAPEADVSAFEGALEVTGVEISSDGHSIIVRGEAVEDLGGGAVSGDGRVSRCIGRVPGVDARDARAGPDARAGSASADRCG